MSTNGQAGPADFDGSLALRGGSIEIYMQGRQLDDAGAERWCAWARDAVPEFLRRQGVPRRHDGFLAAREVNFSNNCLGDHGMTAILRTMYGLRLGVKVLKLFKNSLGRAAASALMDWLVVTPIAVLELHLSHNFIPREGAVDILKAVAYNKACYPIESPGRGRVPLWLRLEQNVVANADELLQAAEGQMRKIREVNGGVSTTSGPMLCDCRAAGCRSDFCALSRADGHCPLAQVTYLAHQRDGRMKVPHEAQAWQLLRDQREEAARWRMCAAAAPTPGGLAPGRRAVARPPGAGAAPGLARKASNLSDAWEDDDTTVSASPFEYTSSGRSAQPGDDGTPLDGQAGPPCATPPPLGLPVLAAAEPTASPLPGDGAPAAEAPLAKPPPAQLRAPGTAKAAPPAMAPAEAADPDAPRFLRGPVEVKAPPPGFEVRRPPAAAAPGAGRRAEPPEVKPPPPGFEVGAPPAAVPPRVARAPGAGEAPRPAAREFKAPPMGLEVPTKAPPAWQPEDGPASPANGVLSRAMREAPIKAPPSRAHASGPLQDAAPPISGFKDPPMKQPVGFKEPPVVAKGPPVFGKSPPIVAPYDSRDLSVDGTSLPAALKAVGSLRPVSIEQRPPQGVLAAGPASQDRQAPGESSLAGEPPRPALAAAAPAARFPAPEDPAHEPSAAPAAAAPGAGRPEAAREPREPRQPLLGLGLAPGSVLAARPPGPEAPEGPGGPSPPSPADALAPPGSPRARGLAAERAAPGPAPGPAAPAAAAAAVLMPGPGALGALGALGAVGAVGAVGAGAAGAGGGGSSSSSALAPGRAAPPGAVAPLEAEGAAEGAAFTMPTPGTSLGSVALGPPAAETMPVPNLDGCIPEMRGRFPPAPGLPPPNPPGAGAVGSSLRAAQREAEPGDAESPAPETPTPQEATPGPGVAAPAGARSRSSSSSGSSSSSSSGAPPPRAAAPGGPLQPRGAAAPGAGAAAGGAAAEPELDLGAEHPPEVLKSEIHRHRKEIQDLRLRLSEAEEQLRRLQGTHEEAPFCIHPV